MTHENQYLGRLLAAWTHMRRDDRAPAYGDLRPEALRFILPDICLIDVPQEGDYRFRLVGTGIVERLPKDPTGEPLNVLSTQTANALTDLFAPTVARSVPMAATGRLMFGNADRVLDALCLPLTGATGAISILLVGIEFRPWSDVKIEPPLGEIEVWEVETGALPMSGAPDTPASRRGKAAC